MGQETAGEVLHRTAPVTAVGMLMYEFLAQFGRTVGEDPGDPGHEAERTEICPLPGAPGTGEVDRFAEAADLVILLSYPAAGLLDIALCVAERQLLRGAPAAAVVAAVDGGAQVGELGDRRRTSRVPRRPPSAL